jgi:hypothetical protein
MTADDLFGSPSATVPQVNGGFPSPAAATKQAMPMFAASPAPAPVPPPAPAPAFANPFDMF